MPLRNWRDLVIRLRDYAAAASAFGGFNDLDKALHMAADGLETYVPGAGPRMELADPAKVASILKETRS